MHIASPNPKSPFGTYDFRGRLGLDFTLGTVERVGRFLPGVLKAKKILVGRDARATSPDMAAALIKGLTESGARVTDMELATTPMVYHFTAVKNFDASVQITASHNPPEYNGLKISRKGSLPFDTASLQKIKVLVDDKNSKPEPVANSKGCVQTADYTDEFIRYLEKWKSDFSCLRFAVDATDGSTGLIAAKLFGNTKNVTLLNCGHQGDFHKKFGPNPLEAAIRKQLSKIVRDNKLDLGIIFDGDGDRVMFVDETGGFVQPDYLIPVLARHFLATNPAARVVHDIRTSRGATAALRADGAVPIIWKVGHVFLKEMLRETDSVCGGELAGHYYFRDFHNCDSAEVASLIILGQFAKARRNGVRTFSQFIEKIRCHPNSGETNHVIADEKKGRSIAAVRDAALKLGGTPLAIYGFDGIRLDFPHWWINVRKSNTEPFVRLILEADTQELFDTLFPFFEKVLKPFVNKKI